MLLGALLISVAAHFLRPFSGETPPAAESLAEAEKRVDPTGDPAVAEPQAQLSSSVESLPAPEETSGTPATESGALAESEDPRVSALAAIFEEAAASAGLAGAAIGFALLDADGETIFDHHGATALIPASVLKTLTTATALESLGPDFRFETRLGLSQANTEAALEGDLILRGGGDPTLGLEDLTRWAESLAEAGLVSLSGRVIGDGRYFSGSTFPDFWDWGDIGNGYGSPVSGLNLERNRFRATLTGGAAEGEPALLTEIRPEVPGVSWWNETTTGPPGSGDGVTIYGGERTTVMHLRGTVPEETELTVRGAVPDPEKFAAHHLREALLAAGIEVNGSAVSAGELYLAGEAVPEILEELLVQQSPPLPDLVRSIHATSDNHETECVFRAIGFAAALPPAEAVRAHWSERGLELDGLRMVDGSGLARANHIPALTLARLQHFAANGPQGELYTDSLLSGMDGRLLFKAGMMSSIRSYTGFVESEGGERYAFAMLANHYPEPAAVSLLVEDVLSAIAAW